MNKEIRKILEEANLETVPIREKHKKEEEEKKKKIDNLKLKAINNAKIIEKEMLKDFLNKYEAQCFNMDRENECSVTRSYMSEEDFNYLYFLGEDLELAKEYNDRHRDKIVICSHENGSNKELLPVFLGELANSGLGHFFEFTNNKIILTGSYKEIDDFLFDVSNDEYAFNFDLALDEMLRDTRDSVRELRIKMIELNKKIKRNTAFMYREIVNEIVKQYKENPIVSIDRHFSVEIPHFGTNGPKKENEYEKKYSDADKELIEKYNNCVEFEDMIVYFVINNNGKQTLVPTSYSNLEAIIERNGIHFVLSKLNRLYVSINSYLFERDMLTVLDDKPKDKKKIRKKVDNNEFADMSNDETR